MKKKVIEVNALAEHFDQFEKSFSRELIEYNEYKNFYNIEEIDKGRLEEIV
jgi:hypothetical protein